MRALIVGTAIAVLNPVPIYTSAQEVRETEQTMRGPVELDSLITILKTGKREDRKKAAKMLGRLGNSKAVPALVDALRGDKSEGVREEAAEALGAIGDRDAVEPLVRALNDRDGGVRRDAARALGKLNDPSAIRPLLQALAGSDDPWMVEACQQSLRSLDFLNRITIDEK